MVKTRCPKCGKYSYTASPKAATKCAYCSHYYKTEEIYNAVDENNENNNCIYNSTSK